MWNLLHQLTCMWISIPSSQFKDQQICNTHHKNNHSSNQIQYSLIKRIVQNSIMTVAKNIAGRVFRLESYLLDTKLDETIDDCMNQLGIPYFNEELKTLLRLYLATSNIKTNSTVGMRVYDMNYCDAANLDQDLPSKYKMIALTALNLSASHISRKSDSLDKVLKSSIVGRLHLSWLNLDNLILFIKSISVLNFLIFLKDGTYLSLAERLLDLVPVLSDESHCQNVQLHKIHTGVKYREVAWRAITEFLSTILPLIDVNQVKSNLCKFAGLKPDLSSGMKLSEKLKREDTKCAVCLKQPFNPYEIGCRHVFCYYCLQSKFLSDPSVGYSCSSCKYCTNELSDAKRYKPLYPYSTRNIKT